MGVMDAGVVVPVVLAGGGIAVGVWVLHKIGKALKAVAEVLAAAAVVFVALWWLGKGVCLLVWLVITHPRSAITLMLGLCWWHWWGWPSLAITATLLALGLAVWRHEHLPSF
ncbi:MAG: cell division protein FtsK, partial [Sciscionella sp.]